MHPTRAEHLNRATVLSAFLRSSFTAEELARLLAGLDPTLADLLPDPRHESVVHYCDLAARLLHRHRYLDHADLFNALADARPNLIAEIRRLHHECLDAGRLTLSIHAPWPLTRVISGFIGALAAAAMLAVPAFHAAPQEPPPPLETVRHAHEEPPPPKEPSDTKFPEPSPPEVPPPVHFKDRVDALLVGRKQHVVRCVHTYRDENSHIRHSGLPYTIDVKVHGTVEGYRIETSSLAAPDSKTIRCALTGLNRALMKLSPTPPELGLLGQEPYRVD